VARGLKLEDKKRAHGSRLKAHGSKFSQLYKPNKPNKLNKPTLCY
jgi:hypothetical protein